MDTLAIADPAPNNLTVASAALLGKAVAEISARRRMAGPSPEKTCCAVCPNGNGGCDNLACDPEISHDVSPVVLRRFERCEAILAARLSLDPIDPMGCNPELSLESLHWRCERALRCAGKLPPETLGAWLGFVEGCLAMRGMIAADEVA